MNIEKDKVVAVTYELRTESHESAVVETTTKEKPLQFIFGKGMMLPVFEEKLEGKANNDPFQFVLQANEAYGEYLEENKIDIPKKSFEVEGKIQEGLLNINNIVSMQDNQGNQFSGKVLALEGENVKMDFNHPMAGQTLYFTGQIIDVRDATPEELEHGHVH